MERREHTYGYEDAAGVTPPPWTGPAVGLMDLDAFFASVEMLDHPEWRGKPLIVGGDAESRGVVSTCSYEARRFGVHSAMASAEARRLCPQAIWTHGHFDRYREVSAQVMEILADETPRVERVSIDEAFIDITPGRFAPEDPLLVARRMSDRVAALGVTCSIGVGCNKTVAKNRCSVPGRTMVRPNGLSRSLAILATVLLHPTPMEQRFLAALPVSAMSGIGRSAEERLRRMRIYTLGELSRAPESTLAAIFGVNGECMRQRALGLEVSEVTSLDDEREVKSVSNERTFAKDLTERGDIEAAIALLGESVGRRLRRQGLTGGTVTLKLKYSYCSGRTAQRRLPHPTDDENIFVAVALELLDNIWQEGMHVRLAGIGMSDFNHQGGIQTDLFCEIDDRGAQSSDRRDLSVAIDAVRDKFGDTALSFGRQSRFND